MPRPVALPSSLPGLDRASSGLTASGFWPANHPWDKQGSVKVKGGLSRVS